jgi:hypothetical protein
LSQYTEGIRRTEVENALMPDAAFSVTAKSNSGFLFETLRENGFCFTFAIP